MLFDLGLPSTDPSELITAVKAGLRTKAFEALAEELGVTEARLASVTGISASTLQRRKKAGSLSAEEGERLLRVARLLATASDLFGDTADAADWMRSVNPSLGNVTPLAYSDTEIGAREVENLLGRIAYGVYS